MRSKENGQLLLDDERLSEGLAAGASEAADFGLYKSEKARNLILPTSGAFVFWNQPQFEFPAALLKPNNTKAKNRELLAQGGGSSHRW